MDQRRSDASRHGDFWYKIFRLGHATHTKRGLVRYGGGDMSEIWYMDSEFCDVCDTLLDGFGICPECGFYEEDEDEYTDLGDYDEPLYYIGEYDQELASEPSQQ